MTRRRELTTVAQDCAVIHDGDRVEYYDGLRPDTHHELGGFSFRTLPHPGGELLCRFATVNDVHFGETVCGYIEGLDSEVLTVADDEEPYPITMNRGAIAEIAAIRPVAVIAKGDLTSEGHDHEYRDFLSHYHEAFGDRLTWIRGNHDCYRSADLVPGMPRVVHLPGATVALIDTTKPGEVNGTVRVEQIEWLDELAARADRPVLVMGHHHIWNPDSDLDSEHYFGIEPHASAQLIDVFTRRRRLVGYFAGHTHRNRVVCIDATGDRPWVEVACVKDFPGSWAEYRVFEGGVLQVHRRVSGPTALAWTNRTRAIYQPLDYTEYALGSLDDRCFRIC